MKLQPSTIRTLRRASVQLFGGAAALWCLSGAAATTVDPIGAVATTAAAPSKAPIIIVGGRSEMRLNPQPLPPRW